MNKVDTEIKNIEQKSFDELMEYSQKKNYLKFLNSFSVSSINTKKLKNFVIACVEEENLVTKLKSKPYKIIVDPTNACNLGCPLCPTGLGASERVKKILGFETFKNVIDQVKDYAIEVHLYNWGEPTLNKKLIEMLKYCEKNNLWTRISTNLSRSFKTGYIEDLLNSGLNLLHVDVDGLDQEVYSKYRRKGDISLVYKNLEIIKKIKKDKNLKKPIIELSMLAMRQNEHQHNEFLNLKEKFGADVIKIDKIQHNPNMDEQWLPENKSLVYRTYDRGESKSTSAREGEKIPCHWPWSGIVVNSDGSINPCCIIDDPKSDFDNLENNNIYNIWNSEEYVSARSEFGDKKEITKNTICNICKNETHSKRLNRVSKSFAIKI